MIQLERLKELEGDEGFCAALAEAKTADALQRVLTQHDVQISEVEAKAVFGDFGAEEDDEMPMETLELVTGGAVSIVGLIWKIMGGVPHPVIPPIPRKKRKTHHVIKR